VGINWRSIRHEYATLRNRNSIVSEEGIVAAKKQTKQHPKIDADVIGEFCGLTILWKVA
jgi:hypothetical protein